MYLNYLLKVVYLAWWHGRVDHSISIVAFCCMEGSSLGEGDRSSSIDMRFLLGVCWYLSDAGCLAGTE